MKLTRLPSHQSLVTKPSVELIDFATFLDIPLDIDLEDDHIFIIDSKEELALESFRVRRGSDVHVSTEIFCEVLMDIKSGMTVLEAFNKQGYTFDTKTEENAP